MAKPTVLPVFATNTNYSSGPASGTPTKIEPPAAYTENGYVDSDSFTPVAQYENWRENLVCSWIAWLDDTTHGARYTVGDGDANTNHALTLDYQYGVPGGGNYTDTTNTLKVPQDGVYELTLSVRTTSLRPSNANPVATVHKMNIMKNGTPIFEFGSPVSVAGAFLTFQQTERFTMDLSTSDGVNFLNDTNVDMSVGSGLGTISIRRVG